MYRRFGKRLFDVVFSFLGLIVTAPLFLIIPVMIKCDSEGPVFFRHKRMGLGGRTFFSLKFRSMTAEKDSDQKEFEPGDSLRVTKVGRILRITKLDEIPQLVNVLVGDMSFVGPRPEVPLYRDFYTGEFKDVLSIRPGITDWASLKYCNEEMILAQSSDPKKAYREIILPDKLKLMLSYVRNGICLKTDIGIFFQTLWISVKQAEHLVCPRK